MASRVGESSVTIPVEPVESDVVQLTEELNRFKSSKELLDQAQFLYKQKKFEKARDVTITGLSLNCRDFSVNFLTLIDKIEKQRAKILLNSEAEKLHNEAKQILTKLETTSDLKAQKALYLGALGKLNDALKEKMTNDKNCEIHLDKAIIYNSMYTLDNNLVYLEHAIGNSIGALVLNNSNSGIVEKIKKQLKQSYIFLFNYKINTAEKQIIKDLYSNFGMLFEVIKDDEKFAKDFEINRSNLLALS